MVEGLNVKSVKETRVGQGIIFAEFKTKSKQRIHQIHGNKGTVRLKLTQLCKSTRLQ